MLMSLLDRGRETVTVYPEETWTDPDGNVISRPSPNGIQARATIQPRSQVAGSGPEDEGFYNREVYRVRFPRNFPYILGGRSQIEWNGERWGIFQEVRRYNSSPSTAHVDYLIERA